MNLLCRLLPVVGLIMLCILIAYLQALLCGGIATKGKIPNRRLEKWLSRQAGVRYSNRRDRTTLLVVSLIRSRIFLKSGKSPLNSERISK